MSMVQAATKTVGDASSSSALSPSVSIVIPVRNEEARIGHCLAAITKLDFTGRALDVVIVDNGSTDQTVAIAQGFADRLNLSILERPGVRISALRNAGVAASKGELVAFLDADCIPASAWLSSAIDLMLRRGKVVIGSDYLIPPNSSWVARAWYGSEPLPELAPVSFVPSGDLLVSRAVFNEIGGFNESIQTNEDCEFCLRARMAGFPVYAASSVAVVHLGTPQTLLQFFQKNVWHGTHVFRVFRKNAATMQNAKPLAFAAYTLLASLGILSGAGLAIATRKFAVLAVSAVALICGPVLLATHKAVQQKRVANILPLTALFLLYGFARAISLLKPANW
ncbi:MAG: glycosyltransferase [Acidobacteriia bacterium]|nr:glycosyltransferase [Terriglobia bacterium]